MQIVIADATASSNCPARKQPKIAIAYAPRKNSPASIRSRLTSQPHGRPVLSHHRRSTGESSTFVD
jgi:hypothetical protein